jgi:hypothetical protein
MAVYNYWMAAASLQKERMGAGHFRGDILMAIFT